MPPTDRPWNRCPIDISDEDAYEAMKSIPGYLDITPGDFRAIYQVAFRQAMTRLNATIKARQVMTRQVRFATRDATLLEAAVLMAEHRITGLPVVDAARKVVGVVSEKDFLREIGAGEVGSCMEMVARCLQESGCLAISLKNRQVREIMSTPPLVVDEGTSFRDIAALFERKHINRVPVTDAEGRLVGIVTRTDMVQAFCAQERGKGRTA